jgi:hypothetical protein
MAINTDEEFRMQLQKFTVQLANKARNEKIVNHITEVADLLKIIKSHQSSNVTETTRTPGDDMHEEELTPTTNKGDE